MRRLLKHPTAFLPLSMSAAALAIVAVHLALHGTAPQEDEGTAVHLWQLLVLAQVPLWILFAVRWVPSSPRPAVGVLGIQVVAALAAAAPVLVLGW